MSENNCNRCGRELMDPNADYGWRCAKKVGVKYGSDSEDWELRGFRVAVQKAESFLKRNGLTIKESERENFYKAVVNMMVATYYDDVCAWEDAFWHMYYALFPADKGKNGKTDAVQSANMQTMLDLVKWISEADMPKSKAASSKSTISSGLPDALGIVPRYSTMPISPLDVLEKMLQNGYDEKTGKKKDDTEEGSILFWTEQLDSLGGRSRMEAWTFPIDLADIKKDGISFNFNEKREIKDDDGNVIKTRSHAAIDIHTQPNTPIHAVTDGIVVDQGWYYTSTDKKSKVSVLVYAVTVLNFDGSITRYCEMHNLPIAAGTVVRQGDIVGYTKKMITDTMLHIEVYENSAYHDTVYTTNFQQTKQKVFANVNDGAYGSYERRGDLINPTMIGALSPYTGNSFDLTVALNPDLKWRR